MRYQTIIFAVLSLFCVSYANAQTQEELDKLDEKISHQLEVRMIGWTHKRGEPIQGSKGVLIENWSFPNRGVKIAVTSMKSPADARQSLQSFLKDTKEAEFLKGFGDEAYIWGYGGSDLVVRRGKHIVYINAGVNVDSDPAVRALSQSERQARQNLEMRGLTKEFAKHIINALDQP